MCDDDKSKMSFLPWVYTMHIQCHMLFYMLTFKENREWQRQPNRIFESMYLLLSLLVYMRLLKRRRLSPLWGNFTERFALHRLSASGWWFKAASPRHTRFRLLRIASLTIRRVYVAQRASCFSFRINKIILPCFLSFFLSYPPSCEYARKENKTSKQDQVYQFLQQIVWNQKLNDKFSFIKN